MVVSELFTRISELPEESKPEHVAIIMDGNGRWATRQNRSRVFGLRAGFTRAREIIAESSRLRIKSLTLFAFSTENWSRPASEVDFIMRLFMHALTKEVDTMIDNGVKLNIIGDRSRFSDKLQSQMLRVEKQTQHNSGLILNIAANYGGRWDILQATKNLAMELSENKLSLDDLDEDNFTSRLSMSTQAPVDLMIRTSGEYRISNFVLWQAAYAEFVFSPVCWPDFTKNNFHEAILEYASRQRRFGLTGEQVAS